MKTFVAIVLALFCLAPMAQAGGHFRGGYGRGYGGYGYQNFSFAPVYSYSLFTPFVPVQAVYQQPVLQAAPVFQAAPILQAAPVVAAEVAPVYQAPLYSTGFSGYADSHGFSRDFYGRRFHRPGPAPKPAPKAIRRR